MKRIGFVFLILFILIAGFLFAKNLLAGALITKGIKAVTGLDSNISSARLGLSKTYLAVNELKIFNPSGFADKTLADLPEIYADYNLWDFLRGVAHLEELRINLKELDVVRSKNNQVNVSALKAFMLKGGGRLPEIRIDNLSLKIGKVVYKDYWSGKPDIREFDINATENFKNINDPKALVSLILFRALSKTSIPNLANIDLGRLKEDVRGIAVGKVEATAREFEKKAQETIEKTGEKIKDILQPQ